MTVHSSSLAKSLSGSRVNVVGPPVTVAVWAPDDAHEIVNQVPVTLTGSEKVMSMLEARATPVAALVGVVLDTVGARSAGSWAVTEKSSMERP